MVFDWFKNKQTSVQGVQKRTRQVKLFKVGESIGGEFKIQKAMHGGMGAVYIVSHREYEEPLILKSLLFSNNPTESQYFRREAETWVALGSHSNLVQAYWAREIQGELYVGAEYVAPDDMGRNCISDYLRFGPIPVPIILYWTIQFCDGMDYAITHGLVAHRDIKPGNLMVSALGELKITDFGLAKPYVTGGRITKLSKPTRQQDTFVGSGTPAYMAPEQILGNVSCDFRTDMYGFGISMYEMCKGRLPFIDSNIDKLFQLHVSGKYVPTGTVLDPILEKCLSKRKEDRYQSYEELRMEAKSLLKSMGLPEPPRPDAVKGEADGIYTKALSYSALGKPDLAMQCVDQYLKLKPTDFKGWTQKGRLLLEAGLLKQARAATEKSIQLNPLNSHSWNNLGLIHRRQNDHEAAIKSLSKALEVDPYNTGSMMNLGLVLSEFGQIEQAKKLLIKAVNYEPEKAALWNNLGVMQLDTGEFSRARDCFEQAIKLNPKLETAEQLLRSIKNGTARADPICLMRNGRALEAVPLLIERTHTNPMDATAWHNLGLIYLIDKKDRKEAMRCFAKVLSVNEKDEFALEQLGRLSAEAGDLKAALQYSERLGQIAGHEKTELMRKAQILQAMGRGDESVGILKKMLNENPSSEEAWMVLGEVYSRMGQKGPALDAYKKCEALIKDNPGASQNLQFLRERIRSLEEP